MVRTVVCSCASFLEAVALTGHGIHTSPRQTRWFAAGMHERVHKCFCVFILVRYVGATYQDIVTSLGRFSFVRRAVSCKSSFFDVSLLVFFPIGSRAHFAQNNLVAVLQQSWDHSIWSFNFGRGRALIIKIVLLSLLWMDVAFCVEVSAVGEQTCSV